MIVALQDLACVESVILLHLLLHKVLHDARVPILAGCLNGCMLILRVVEQCFATLVFVEWRLILLAGADASLSLTVIFV